MASQTCAFSRSADEACIAFSAGGVLESVHAILPVDLDWATASPETLPEDTQAWDIVGDTPAVDSLHYVWLLVVVVGTSAADHPILLIEQSQAPTIADVLTTAGVAGDYSVWGRLIDGRLENVTQDA